MDQPLRPEPEGPVGHPDSASPTLPFAYDQDQWDLAYRTTTAVVRSASIVHFDGIPSAWKADVKAFMADGVLGRNLSNSWAQATMSRLRLLIRLASERHDRSDGPLTLDQGDARRIEVSLRDRGQVSARRTLQVIAEFAEFVRGRHEGDPRGFHPDAHAVPTVHQAKTHSKGWERVIPDEVSAALMQAVQNRWTVLQAENRPFHGGQLRSEELYLAVLVLLLFSGRRISEILWLPRECLRDPTPQELDQTGPGLWLLHHNTKTGTQFAEAFIPEPAAKLVRNAVTRVQTLTQGLVDTSHLDRLFLTNARAGALDAGTIRGVSSKAFTLWLNGRMTEAGEILRPGFIHRADIRYDGEYYPIDPHQARHTLAHKAYTGGAGYAQVSDHLGHRRTRAGLNPMTGVYIHGEPVAVLQILDHAEQGRLAGTAAPLVENRAAVVALEPQDVTIYQEQGMIVLPTHYGHCCLPASSGPCVSGDPCWIGPHGDGCDYALYTPESRAALEKDRELLQHQLNLLTEGQPYHPRLGQLKTRLARIEQVLAEIATARSTERSELLPMISPRAGLTPREPNLAESSLPPSSERRLKWRRREAALTRGAGFPPYRGVRVDQAAASSQPVVFPMSTEWRTEAETLLAELEFAGHPLTVASFAKRLRIPLRAVLQVPDILDRLRDHNARYELVAEDRMGQRLTELREQELLASYREFAALRGVSARTLFLRYPTWCRRITEHNQAVKRQRTRNLAEERLACLEAGETVEPVGQFAKALHRDRRWLRRTFPDIVDRLVRHNRRLGLQGAHTPINERRAAIQQEYDRARDEGVLLSPELLAARCHVSVNTIRIACPELLAEMRKPAAKDRVGTAWEELAKRDELLEVDQLGRAADVSLDWFSKNGRQWRELISQHNQQLNERRLEHTWERYIAQGKRWSAKEFAEAAGFTYSQFRVQFPEWNGRVVNVPKDDTTRRRLEQLLTEVRQSGEIVSPVVFAQRAEVAYTTVLRHYPDIYADLRAHAMEFRPRIESHLAEVEALGQPVSMSTFCLQCGITHYSHLLAYFPDIADRIRTLNHPGGG